MSEREVVKNRGGKSLIGGMLTCCMMEYCEICGHMFKYGSVMLTYDELWSCMLTCDELWSCMLTYEEVWFGNEDIW